MEDEYISLNDLKSMIETLIDGEILRVCFMVDPGRRGADGGDEIPPAGSLCPS